MHRGELVRDAVAAWPTDEPVIESLHAELAEMMRSRPQTARDKVAIRLLSSTPALRARQVEKHVAWAELLTPVVARRLTGPDVALRSRVLVQIVLEAFTLALAAWAEASETRDVHELLDLAFDTVQHP